MVLKLKLKLNLSYYNILFNVLLNIKTPTFLSLNLFCISLRLRDSIHIVLIHCNNNHL